MDASQIFGGVGVAKLRSYTLTAAKQRFDRIASTR
jgi:hypothetical protein